MLNILWYTSNEAKCFAPPHEWFLQSHRSGFSDYNTTRIARGKNENSARAVGQTNEGCKDEGGNLLFSMGPKASSNNAGRNNDGRCRSQAHTMVSLARQSQAFRPFKKQMGGGGKKREKEGIK